MKAKATATPSAVFAEGQEYETELTDLSGRRWVTSGAGGATATGATRTVSLDSASSATSLNAGTSPAAAGTTAVAAVTGFSNFKAITIVATITGATGGVLDVFVQHSPDGTTWYDYVHFTQAGIAAAAQSYSHAPTLDGTVTAIGTGNTSLTTGLAAGSGANGHWFDQMRVLYIAGTGTSAGAAQTINVLGVKDTP